MNVCRRAVHATTALGLAASCTIKSGAPASVEQVCPAIAQAARAQQGALVYELLDQQTRWSLLSLFNDQRQIRGLVRQHYPAARQARELQRTEQAGRATDVKAYFALLAGQHKQLELLSALACDSLPKPINDRVFGTAGQRKVPFCLDRDDKGGSAWRYCGLRDFFHELKVRAARDLQSVREAAESYKQGS